MFQFAVLTLATLNAVLVLGDRIIGGSDANITEVPYQVLILTEHNGNLRFLCGGSIISEKYILSAAHCFEEKAKNYYVRYGSSFADKGGILVNVSRVETHKDYDLRTLQNDISLLLLEKPIKFDDYAKKIDLSNSEEKLEDGTLVTISGWGTIEAFAAYPKQLQKASVPIVDSNKCSRAYDSFLIQIKPGMICAGVLGIGGTDACKGDSGGPLALNNKLYGITSWGNGCAKPRYPGVYTNVAYFRYWIDSKLGKYDAL